MKQLRNSVLPVLFLCTSTMAKNYSYSVKVKNAGQGTKLRATLTNICHFWGQEGNYLSLTCPVEIGPSLKNSPLVHSFARSYPLYPAADARNGGHSQNSLPSSSTSATCAGTPLCSNGKNRAWATEAVDGDLMQEALEKLGHKGSRVKIAVLDTGFDVKTQRSRMKSSQFRVAKGFDEAGNPSTDRTGHGTRVSALIGGGEGIGLAPQHPLTVYRMEEASGKGEIENSNIMLSLKKACAEGNEVINLSWGGALDESEGGSDEKYYGQIFKELADQGCLVVKASGNEGYKQERRQNSIDDNLLRVEASGSTGFESYFSTKGEISAPGQQIFTFRSHDQEASKTEEGCPLPENGLFVSGTSYASPLTAALAAQVMHVLKSSEVFKKLTGSERTTTAVRVLLASVKDGMVNGLRAVTLADSLAKNFPTSGIPTTADLKSEMEKLESPCPSTFSCLTTNACSQRGACLREIRRSLAFCRSLPNESLHALVAAARENKSFDWAVRLLKQAERKSESDTQKLRASAKALSQQLRMHQKEPEFETQVDLLLMKLQGKNSPEEKSELTAELRKLLDSPSLLKRYNGSPDATSKVSDQLRAVLLAFREQFGSGTLSEVLAKSFDLPLTDAKELNQAFLSLDLIRILESPGFGDMKSEVQKHRTQFLDRLLRMNLAAEYFVPKLKHFHNQGKYFQKEFQNSLSDGEGALNSVSSHYYRHFAEENTLGRHEKWQHLWRDVDRLIPEVENRGDTSFRVTLNEMLGLRTKFSDLMKGSEFNDEEKASLRQKFRQKVLDSKNPALHALLIPNIGTVNIFDAEDRLYLYQRDPLFQKEDIPAIFSVLLPHVQKIPSLSIPSYSDANYLETLVSLERSYPEMGYGPQVAKVLISVMQKFEEKWKSLAANSKGVASAYLRPLDAAMTAKGAFADYMKIPEFATAFARLQRAAPVLERDQQGVIRDLEKKLLPPAKILPSDVAK